MSKLHSSAGQLAAPRYEELVLLKDVVHEIGAQPSSRVRYGKLGEMVMSARGFKTEHDKYIMKNGTAALVMSTDVICLVALSKIGNDSEELQVRYREYPLRGIEVNQCLVHDYALKSQSREMTIFSQRIIASPKLPQPRMGYEGNILTDQQLDQVQSGSEILECYLGEELELSAGDCGVLYDRLHESFLK